jgi:hypothetical protein
MRTVCRPSLAGSRGSYPLDGRVATKFYPYLSCRRRFDVKEAPAVYIDL